MNSEKKKILDYYSKAGMITNPGKHENSMQSIQGVKHACDLINNVMLIDFLVNMKIIKDLPINNDDINIRSAEDILDTLMARDNHLITNPRKHEDKVLGNCRDTSVLLCTLLRQNNIPARVRSGFATFFSKKKKYDHWLCEYYDKSKSRWIKVDSWMFQIHFHQDILPPFYKRGLTNLSYDPLNVDEKHFIPGGQAWNNCIEDGEDPNSYGTYEKKLRGLWFIRDNMLRDMLCLNKVEPLPWDCKGLMSGERGRIPSKDKETLSFVANLLSDVEENFEEIRKFYSANKDLHIYIR